MADETRDATSEEFTLEEAIRRWETEFAFRQSNILPMDSAYNVGRFYGLLIRAARPRNTMERVGFIFFGVMWTAGAVPSLPISALLFPLGLKLLWTACRPAIRESAGAD
jgi:hypothetical protein